MTEMNLKIAKELNVDVDVLSAALEKHSLVLKSKPKARKEPTGFTTEKVRLLSEKHGYYAEDYSIEERSGRELKSGLIQININDVYAKAPEARNKLGVKAFSSEKAYEKALEHDWTPSDFNSKGKITLAIVDAKIAEMEPVDELVDIKIESKPLDESKNPFDGDEE